ncbi:MAG: zinc-ribbon domain-containing protein [Alphaproteobacteria bacterium]|nr:zinc-ribbon domain-containing protein [Alphaproteobacteria bacterium]
MILTCPECATSYFVDDARIPKAGRTVKCSSCGARWTASNEPVFVPPAPEVKPRAERRAPEAVAEAQPSAPEADPADDLEFVTVEREPAPRRRAARAPTPKGEAKGKVFVWVAAAGIVVAVVAGALVFRTDVVRFWPNSRAAYAGLGLPVNSVGLVIEAVHAEPTFVGGRPVLSVTGAIRNVKDQAVNSPAIRVNLLNHAGKAVAAKIVRPIDPRVPAGATRHFAIAISDPPSNARDLEVVFDLSPEHAASTPPPAAPAAPAPAVAQPLPPGSPDALSHG